ncbi:hypothetical protein VNO77_15646 [Canavalia gladiata]|uniref:Uncharacterized protein n=1 Tax=Canavalia gladiata TaxID=3824 RepID=A0AAN9LZQ7_CANGL
MQAAKQAVENIKETAANIGASAKSGLEKTKASIQEKTEKMSAHDEIQKEIATRKKEERINQAEIEKQQAREYNAAAKQSAMAGHMSQAHYTNSGPGTETATDLTIGSRPETDATYSTTGPGPEIPTTYSTTGPGIETAIFPATGSGPDTATHPIGEYAQPMGITPMDVVGSNPSGTNTGVDSTAPMSGHNFS